MQNADPAQRLEAVLIAENEALERHDAAAAAALLDEKLAAATALSAEHSNVEISQRLRDLAADNRRLLERAMMVQGEIIAMVVRAAQSTVPVARYGAEGRKLPNDAGLAITRQA